MALSRVRTQLYELIFKNYTYKQWGKYPHELDAEVLARIPVRANHDDRYFADKISRTSKRRLHRIVSEHVEQTKHQRAIEHMFL